MNAYQKMIRAMQIFDGYDHDRSYSLGSYEIWAGPDPQRLSAADLAELETLGWSPAPQYNCFSHLVS